MSNTIQIKRGAGVPPDGSLAPYELGYDTSNNKLYIGGFIEGEMAPAILISDRIEQDINQNTECIFQIKNYISNLIDSLKEQGIAVPDLPNQW